MSEQETYTKEQVEQYGEEIARQFSEGKANTHSFFTKVIQDKDTSKTGNLSVEELGNPQISVRGLKELELFSRDIEQNNLWANYFDKMAEITLGTSLSKEGFLLRLSVTNKKEIADVTPTKKQQNKGWFKKKGDSSE